MKTIDEIKEEVAEEYGYKTNSVFSALEQIIINPHNISYKDLSNIFDQVAIRYASQFQDRIKELEGMLVRVRKRLCIGSVGLKPLTYRISKKLINRDYE